MKIKNIHSDGISIILKGNPPNTRIYAELTEAELKFIQEWRQEIANAPRLAATRNELKEAKRQLAKVRQENEQRGKNGPR